MTHDVFISHSSRDRLAADALCAALEARKIRCWIAPRDVIAALNYAGQITRAIKASRVLVLVFSEHSNVSSGVLSEIELAANSRIHILNLRVDDTTLGDDLIFYLQRRHWLDALTPPMEQHHARLAMAIQTLLALGPSENDPATKTDRLPLETSVSPEQKRKEDAFVDLSKAKAAAEAITEVIPKAAVLSAISEVQIKAGETAGARQTVAQIKAMAARTKESDRNAALQHLAHAQARVGDVVGAKATAATFTDSRFKNGLKYALRDLAIGQAKAGDMSGARATAAAIHELSDKMEIETLIAIAQVRAKAGDPAGARQTIAQAKMKAAVIKDEFDRIDALSAIAEVQAEVGDVPGAKATVAAIGNDLDKINPLRAIAEAQAKSGDFAGAKMTATAIKQEESASWMLSIIAKVQAKKGDVAAVKKTVAAMSSGFLKDSALRTIAVAQAKAGEVAAARETFAQAKSATRSFNIVQQPKALHEIAKAQAQMCDVAGARATAEMIRGSSGVDALYAVANVQAAAGDANGAKGTVASLDDANRKAYVLRNVARAQVKAGDLAWAQETLAEAKAAAILISEENQRAYQLHDIAKAQAEAGDAAAAKATAGVISQGGDAIGLDYKAWALYAIAKAQIKAEGLPEVEGWVQKLTKPFERALCHKALAEARLDLADQSDVKPGLGGSEEESDD